MGLWNILTKEIKLGSHELSWSEPMQFRARLRGDLIWRAVISLSSWLAASGVFLLIFSSNQNPPPRGVALGLGAVLGLGPAVMILFMRKSQVSGTIKLFRDRLVRSRMYAGISANWTETTTWGLGGISRFHIVTDDKVGQPFHVMFFKCEGEWELIGIPTKIDLQKLKSVLSAAGAAVTPANRVPDTFRQPLSPVFAAVSGLVGIALAVVGFVMFQPANAPKGRLPREIAQQRPDFPEPDIGNPRPVNPGAVNPAPVNPGAFDAGFPGGNPAPGFNQNFGGPFPSATVNDESIGTRSQPVGGTGGVPVTRVSREQKPVLGVRHRRGTWSGQEHLAQVSPLYERDEAGVDPNISMAKPGYALGAIEVHAPEFVDGVRLVFMKLAPDGTVDPDDAYLSEWIGLASGDFVRLEQTGKPIIGFHSRDGAVLDALGAVFRK